MRNILIFASVASLAAAVAIYFVSESYKTVNEEDFITDVDVDNYDKNENTGLAESIS